MFQIVVEQIFLIVFDMNPNPSNFHVRMTISQYENFELGLKIYEIYINFNYDVTKSKKILFYLKVT